MAKRDRRSRALLRNLRKQARKGQLTAREKKDLLQQESRFREARRANAPYMGAGLAGVAALLGTPAGQSIMENIAGGVRGLRQDALGAREDRKTFKQQSQQERDIMAAEADQELREMMEKTAGQDDAPTEKPVAEAPVEDAKEESSETKSDSPEGPSREEFDMLQAEAVFSDPVAMGAARAMARDADRDFGRAQFDRAQRILAGEEFTGDPFIDLGVIPIKEEEEADIPNEFFPLDQIYAARARSAYEPEVAPENKGPRFEYGGKVGVKSQAQGGKNPKMQDLMKRIARKYGIK